MELPHLPRKQVVLLNAHSGCIQPGRILHIELECYQHRNSHGKAAHLAQLHSFEDCLNWHPGWLISAAAPQGSHIYAGASTCATSRVPINGYRLLKAFVFEKPDKLHSGDIRASPQHADTNMHCRPCPHAAASVATRFQALVPGTARTYVSLSSA